MTEEEKKQTNDNQENKDILQEENGVQNEIDAAIAKAEEYLDCLQRERASFIELPHRHNSRG